MSSNLSLAFTGTWSDPSNCFASEFLRLLSRVEARSPDSPPPTIGIEIEGSITKNMNRAEFGERVYEFIKKEHPEAEFYTTNARRGAESATIRYQVGGQRHEWRFIKDGSVKTSGTEIEITSPILRTDADARYYDHVLAHMRSQGLKSEAASAGVHVHVGFENATGFEIAALSNTFLKIESSLVQAFSQTKGRRKYTTLTTEERKFAIHKLMNGHLDEKSFIDELMKTDWLGKQRNQNLSFQALHRIGTVEFRLFNSIVSPAEVATMRTFASRFIQAFRTQDPDLIRVLSSHEDMKLEAVFTALKMDPAQVTQSLRTIRSQARKDLLRGLAPNRVENIGAWIIGIGSLALAAEILRQSLVAEPGQISDR